MQRRKSDSKESWIFSGAPITFRERNTSYNERRTSVTFVKGGGPMNKTLKMVLAAAGALVLGGIGEGIGTGLLKKVAKNNDAEETTNNEDIVATAEEPVEVEVEESTETTED
jgi:hypothetical protein